MSEKQYIRLLNSTQPWHGMVAEFIEEWQTGPSDTPMVSFYDRAGRRRCVQANEAEYITEREYFVGVLKCGEVFGD